MRRQSLRNAASIVTYCGMNFKVMQRQLLLNAA
jgi:hypothetical protein